MRSKTWGWIGKYLLVIIVALFLGVILGNLALFKTATLGTPKLTAALLVKFVAHMTALAMVWALGWQVAQQMRSNGRRLNGVAMIVMAFTSLVITAVGYVVLSSFLGPFVTKEFKEVLSWTFILGVFATAVWLVLALFAGAEEMIAAVRDAVSGNRDSERDLPDIA